MSANAERLSPEAVARLLESRRRFLEFLRQRVGSAEEAEDILQNAFVRAIEKGGALRDDESAVAWFYRVLRNAVIDHYRGRAVKERALERFVHEVRAHEEPAREMRGEICGCVAGLLETIKPEYREALRKVDIEERSLAELAGEAGITANNAAVRVHRAREALRKQVRLACGVCATHGCVDCHCRSAAPARESPMLQ